MSELLIFVEVGLANGDDPDERLIFAYSPAGDTVEAVVCHADDVVGELGCMVYKLLEEWALIVVRNAPEEVRS